VRARIDDRAGAPIPGRSLSRQGSLPSSETRAGAALKVFVELRAPGYPGSTYTLTYDAQRDQLQGTYFQAALGQTFAVAFVRLK